MVVTSIQIEMKKGKGREPKAPVKRKGKRGLDESHLCQ
jgi:hypothetical protein